MLSLILALCCTAPAPPTADRAVAEHELPPGTTLIVRGEEVRLEVPSYLITRQEAENLLLAEWERDQAIAALEAQEPEPFPWLPVILVVGAALAAGGFAGGVIGWELGQRTAP